MLQVSRHGDTEVVVLDSGYDGIQQITEILQPYHGLTSEQVLSHGGPGELLLGNTLLDQSTLQQDQAKISTWGKALQSGGDILLYGCDVAQGAVGVQFVQEFAHVTGAPVAANTKTTGGTGVGGDWNLDYSTGPIEAQPAFSAAADSSYGSLLAIGTDLKTYIQDLLNSESASFTQTETITNVSLGGFLQMNTLTLTENATLTGGVWSGTIGLSAPSATLFPGHSFSAAITSSVAGQDALTGTFTIGVMVRGLSGFDGRSRAASTSAAPTASPSTTATASFIYAVAEYYRYTHDIGFVNELWPNVVRAVAGISALRAAAPDRRIQRAGQASVLRAAAGVDQPRGLLGASGALVLGRLLRAARAQGCGQPRRGRRATTSTRPASRRCATPSATTCPCLDRARHGGATGSTSFPGSVGARRFRPHARRRSRIDPRRRAGAPARGRAAAHLRALLGGCAAASASGTRRDDGVLAVRAAQRRRVRAPRPAPARVRSCSTSCSPAAGRRRGISGPRWSGGTRRRRGSSATCRTPGWAPATSRRSANMFAYEREADAALVLAAGIPIQPGWRATAASGCVGCRRTTGSSTYTLRREGPDTLRLRIAGDLGVPPVRHRLATAAAGSPRCRSDRERTSGAAFDGDQVRDRYGSRPTSSCGTYRDRAWMSSARLPGASTRSAGWTIRRRTRGCSRTDAHRPLTRRRHRLHSVGRLRDSPAWEGDRTEDADGRFASTCATSTAARHWSLGYQPVPGGLARALPAGARPGVLTIDPPDGRHRGGARGGVAPEVDASCGASR